MHVRFSTCKGTAVVEEGTEEGIGILSGILIHPDKATIEGFFVQPLGIGLGKEPFLLSSDIIHWGVSIRVRDRAVLGDIADIVRLQDILQQRRPILGQRIRTEAGRMVGWCRDIQFNTERFMLEWLFPKKWFWWGVALPASDIFEVKEEAIIVRDSVAAVPEEKRKRVSTVVEKIEEIVEAGVAEPTTFHGE
ncbi:hypothetical protein A2635_00345 [Candidatus Peribacteria bacterium RIFCSPHIGHO2_01_FULL_51_9]|nr:MAG: hypothetical protein A2635_00345 [Candidatus Peribacteria bacterium RIFCSPHIGHO2_01_FULL_51_9]